MKLKNFAYSGVSGWQINPASLGTDGVDDYGKFSGDLIDVDNSFSFGGFFNTSETDAYLFNLTNTTNNLSAMIYRDGAKTYASFVYDNTDATIYAFDSSPSIDGKTYFVVGVYDSTTKKIKIYIDGIRKNESVVSLTNSTRTINKVIIGKHYWVDVYYDEKISERFVINKALTDSEVRKIWNSNRRRYGL
jgi:hypothetical protein